MKRFLLRRFLANDSNEPFVPNEKFQHPEVASELVVDHFNLSIDGSPILKDVSVTIPANKITCIIGPSGCGKSTLLKSLNRLSDSIEGVKTSGDIRLGDTSIVNCSESDLVELRRRIGLVPQRPTPLPMSIFGNIAYGCKIHGVGGRRQLRRIVRHYLKVVGLWDEVKDRLHSPAVKLSIGQQQRLCLARSLAVEPEFILADEATSALDPVSSKIVEDLFVKLKEQYSIVMVTHTLRQALRIADYVIFIYMGEVIEVGDAQQVFKNPQHELTQKYLSGAIS
ncbi:MAG: phosphate ABC transporter ATP-binding protein [Bacteroidales bacterium]|nr:phosphate ABC transporter ATP-binding protein [Bacteroidales bacterium]MBP5371074.1 phosphate ABC transporter ATP-binding protein [Bacteroidales bacterium]MBR4497325.1 phosphate ABC transporter ATP-binding protein [Bacteroidales bacterium]MBR7034422.1 phosphate ABC transporter ATP-binding protein [Bacteroidales bacterium]MCR4799581.1 phosphate ABC transporter ATP-binding protein [Bacteroidales bacterium]